MARLPARRSGTVDRPGSQAASRWDPFSEFEELYQRMGQLMDSAFDGLWPPLGRAQAPAADLTETGDAYVAEIELPASDTAFERPVWLGRELTDDRRYYNHYLALHPYGGWPASERG